MPPNRDRLPKPPASVIKALLNPALDDLWLYLLQPLPDELEAPRQEGTPGGEPPAHEGR